MPEVRLERRAPCPCGSVRPFVECCLPWEEDFRRLVTRLAAWATTDATRQLAARAKEVFWNAGAPFRSSRGTGSDACFAEWFLYDYVAPRRTGPLLGEFADGAVALSVREEQLLFATLLTPIRAFEVTETPGPAGTVARDLFTGSEGALSPVGLPDGLIRSDIGVARVVPVGRLGRAGISFIRLPVALRGELLAYLRTAYRLSRPGRHISLEDYVDGAAHLYHHFFLERGKEMGGRAHRTCRWAPFVAGRVEYRALELAPIRAALARQSAFECVGEMEEGTRYVWLDRVYGLTLGTLLVRRGQVEVSAETAEDLAGLSGFLETCLRGLVERVAPGPSTSPPSPASGIRHAAPGIAGTTFLQRMVARWPDTPSPLLADRTPRAACLSAAGRDDVAQLLLGLGRSMARQKRIGRAWCDVEPVWEQLDLAPPSPGQRDAPSPRARERPRTVRR